jgi:GNAT superfamily N-acetyltransferase
MPIGSPSIRPRRDEDIDACVRLLELTHQGDGYPVRWPTDARAWVAGGDDLVAAWVAEEAGAVVGHVALRHPRGEAVATWEAGTGLAGEQLGVVCRLFVHPSHRRDGLGRDLLRAAARESARQGLKPVLDVLTKNRGAVRLYQEEGWQAIGDFMFHLPDGCAEPARAYTL